MVGDGSLVVNFCYLQDEDQFFSELTIITPSLLSWLMRRTDVVFPYSRRFAQNFWE
jgi:hypothetical protein